MADESTYQTWGSSQMAHDPSDLLSQDVDILHPAVGQRTLRVPQDPLVGIEFRSVGGQGNDVQAYGTFPVEHWRQIWSNNPLEWVNKEIKRRTNGVGIFPNPDSIVRLVGSVLSEQHDEWQVSKRYFSAESLAKVTGRLDTIPLPLAAAR